MKPLDELLHSRLDDGQGRHRRLGSATHYGPRTLDMPGRQGVLNFSSNDYLGLSLLQENSRPMRAQPSSRLLSGNTPAHGRTEAALAAFLGFESALLFPTGYMANMGLLSAMARKGDAIFMDRYCHASLVDGAILSRAEIIRYPHLDLAALERALVAHPQAVTKWVVTESLFSMDGDIPDFYHLAELKEKHGFHLLVDEAHAIGVYGDEGRGILAWRGLAGVADAITFTLSKSLALQGGAVAGSAMLAGYLVNRCRPLIYTTATPMSHMEHILDRLLELRQSGVQRRHLEDICRHAASVLGIARADWSPILPVMIGDGERTRQVAAALLDAGIHCPAILPPTVPPHAARLRVSLNACHHREDVDRLQAQLSGILGC